MRDDPIEPTQRSDGTDSLVDEFNSWIEELGADPELAVDDEPSAAAQLERLQTGIRTIRHRVNEYVNRKERAYDMYRENLVPDQRRIWQQELREAREIQALLRELRLE